MKKYSWSFSESETFYQNSGDSIEDCINQAKDCFLDMENHYQHIHIGENIAFKPEIDVDQIIYNLVEQAFGKCGEAAEKWLQVDEYKKYMLYAAMQESLENWLKLIGEVPMFYSVDNVSKHEII